MRMTGPPAGRPEAAEAIWSFTRDERAAVEPGRVRLRGGLQALVGVGVGLLMFLFVSPTIGRIVMGIAGFILLSALVSPTVVYAGIEKLFDSLGHLLGRGMTWLLMVPLFYLFFLPFGLLFRRGRRDRLRRYSERDAATYWERREGPTAASHSREHQY
jgi:hypothetical protein